MASHKDVAQIWLFLESHPNPNSLLRELFGYYYLSIRRADWRKRRASFLALCEGIKLIFDYGRAQMLGKDACHASSCNFFIEARDVEETIIQILYIQSEIEGNGDLGVVAAEVAISVSLFVVAGLRLLALYGAQLTDASKGLLLHEIKSLRRDEDNPIIESFIHRIIPCQIEALAEPIGSSGRSRASSFEHYKFETNLDPLPKWSKDQISSYLDKIRFEHPNWLQAYFEIYDLIWAAEAALIQSCRPQVRSDDFCKRNSSRGDLFTLLSSGDPRPAPRNDLSATLNVALLPCHDCSCCKCLDSSNSCSKVASQMLRDRVPFSSMQGSFAISVFRNQLCKSVEATGRLKQGQNCLPQLREHCLEWLQEKRKILDSEAIPDIYIGNCPRMHPIWRKELYIRIKDSGDIGLEALSNGESCFDVNISCKQCEQHQEVSYVRLVEPLSKIAHGFPMNLSAQTSIAEEFRPHLPAAIQRTGTSNSRLSSQSNHRESSNSRPETLPDILSSRQNSAVVSAEGSGDSSNETSDLFRENSADRASRSTSSTASSIVRASTETSLPRIPWLARLVLRGPKLDKSYSLDRSTFSPAGDFLYLWKRGGEKVASLFLGSSSSLADLKTCGPCLSLAAGKSNYAVLSGSASSDPRVELYLQASSSSSSTINLDQSFYRAALAISRSGEFVAVGTENELIIWCPETSGQRKFSIKHTGSGAKPDVTDHIISFSNDDLRVTSAVRFRDGNLSYKSWSLDGEGERGDFIEADSGRSNDAGLSALLLNSAGLTCLTTLTDNCHCFLMGSHRLSSLSRKLREKKHFSDNIQGATQSPSGAKIVLVTADNYFFLIDVNAPRAFEIAENCRLGSTGPCRDLKTRIALAMPSEDKVFVFWQESSGKAMKFGEINVSTGKARHTHFRNRFGSYSV